MATKKFVPFGKPAKDKEPKDGCKPSDKKQPKGNPFAKKAK